MVVRTVIVVLTLEETIELILKNTDYERQDVLKMIEEKRQELGPEVVNEESAAMIVARELGIDLQQISAKARLKIEDITESTRNVTLTAKVINVGSVRTFTRKGEGGEGKVASLVIADETGEIRVALWDERTRIVSEDVVKTGDVIQVRGGYVRKGLNDRLEVNMGRMSGIKVLDEYELEDLDIEIGEAPAGKIAELQDRMFNITLLAKVQRIFPLSTFTRKSDGTEGKVLSMIVADETGSTRLVFWDKDAEQMESAKEGEVIRVKGAYSKTGRYGNIEVHGGRSSQIERGLKIKIDAVEVAPGTTAPTPIGKKEIAEITTQMRDVDVEGRVVRVFPINTFDREGGEGRVQNIIIADETAQIRLTFWNEDVEKIESLQEGDIISVTHAYAKEGFRGGVEVHAGRKAEIEINPKGSRLEQLALSDLSLQPRSIAAGRVMIGHIDENSEGKSVEIYGIVVGITHASPVYPACPSCRKKVEETEGKFTCSVCGDVKKPEYRMLYKITVDDGSGSIRATLFGETGEELLEMTAEKAHELIEKSGNKLEPLEQNSDRMLGRYVAVQGRVSRFRDSLDVTASGLTFPDPVEESKRMRQTIDELMG
ncbi:MAG: DUF2240 family protein [Candidatus Thorarchaeota archaeon]